MNVIVITMNGCSHCGHALKDLEELKTDFPAMIIRTVDIISDEGQNLIAEHGILSSPGVLINGKLAFYGPRSKEEIRTILTATS